MGIISGVKDYFSNYGSKAKSIFLPWAPLALTYESNPAFERNTIKRTMGLGKDPDIDPKHCIGRLRGNPVLEKVRSGQMQITLGVKEAVIDQKTAEAVIYIQLSLKVIGLLDADFSNKTLWVLKGWRKPFYGSDNKRTVNWGSKDGDRTRAAVEKLQICAGIDPLKGRSGQTFEAETLAALERCLKAVAEGKDWHEGCVLVVAAPVVPPPPPTNDEAVVKQLLDNMDKIIAAMLAAKNALKKAGCKDELNALPEVKIVRGLIENGIKLVKDPRIQYDAAKTAEWTARLDGYQKDIDAAIIKKTNLIKMQQDNQIHTVKSGLAMLKGMIEKVRAEISTITSDTKTDIAEIRAQAETLDSVVAARAKIGDVEAKIASVKRSGLCLDVKPFELELARLKKQLEDMISGKISELKDAIERNAVLYYINVGAVESQSNDMYVYAGKLEEIRKECAANGITATISLMNIGELLLVTQSLMNDPDIAARAKAIYRETAKKSDINTELEANMQKRTVGYASLAILRACAEVKGLKGIVVRAKGAAIQMPAVTFEQMNKISRKLAEQQQ